MALPLLLLLFTVISMFGPSDGGWCVCNSQAGTSQMQKTLDFACGNGADCSAIQQNGACYNPNTVPAHCSYAVNSYYQRKQQAQGACDFTGTATLTTSDPSSTGCTYPATPSAAGTSTTPSTTTPTYTNTPPSPGTFSSNTGGVLSGLGPSGNNYDSSDGGLRQRAGAATFFAVALAILRMYAI